MSEPRQTTFQQVCDQIHAIFESSNRLRSDPISLKDKLQTDLGFDSLELAELSVRLESNFGVDVFATHLPMTIAEIVDLLDQQSDESQSKS